MTECRSTGACRSAFAVMICILAWPTVACAQNLQDPLQLLRLTHESVAPGKAAAFARAAASRSQFLFSANWPTVSLALRSVTGPSEVLFLTGYSSLADWGRDREALENRSEIAPLTANMEELLSQRRDISAEFQEDISYRAKYDWSKMRYVDVITILLRPGHGDEYLQNRKIVLAAHKKATVDEHMFIYQVSSGYPGTTFLVIRPAETFDGLDLERRHGDHYMKVLGEEDRKRLHELFAASVQSQEEEFYAVDPVMSYVSASWAASDKTFWLTPRSR